MKIKVTVNLGNYQNVGIESSEFDTIRYCYQEIRETLLLIGEPQTDDFIKRYIDPAIESSYKKGV